ncbi:MAG: hypothetical protein KDB63_19605 [Nocardioidaceae bacterium]|nr:hypothetical protein [Nocardioidaceae bacterium]
MSSPEPAAPPRLKIGAALRPHLLLMAVLGLFFGALVGTAAALLPVEYVATSTVLVQPLDGNSYSPDGAGSDLTRLETEAQVVSSDVIVQAVRSALPDTYAKTNLTKGLGVGIPTNTQIIQITFRAGNAQTATAISNQYAQSYLDYRSLRRDAFISNRQNGIQQRIDNLTDELAQNRKDGLKPNSPEIKAIAAQLQNLRLQLSTLVTADSVPGQIITEPVARRSGLSLPLTIAIPAGVVLGLILGAAFALVRERRLDLLRTVSDVEHLGIPVLGHVLADGSGTEGLETPVDDLPDAALMLAAVLTRRVKSPATIAISAVTADGQPLEFPDALARALAQGHQQVLLIDGASEEASKRSGLSEALTNGPEQIRLARKDKDLSRMDVGRRPTMGRRLYGTPRLDALLDRATQVYDWVVVHAAPTDDTVGRSLVGGCAYWVPVVVLGHTSRDDLERGLQWARTTGSHPLGVVAVDPPSRRHRRGETTSDEEQ